MQDFNKSEETQPVWYSEIPVDERNIDFQQVVGNAQLFLCERETQQLIISFGHTSDNDHPEHDWPAWTDRLARTKGWSHLAITAEKGSWFRDPQLVKSLENLRDLGFFERFGAVTLFGAATHGGGFAALAFAPLCPGATVVALDAQSTLKPATVPWETRFASRDKSAWKPPYHDAAKGLEKVARAYVVFDPFQSLDQRHTDRLPAKRITPLLAFGLYDDIGVSLKRLGLLDDILLLAVSGKLDSPTFYKMLRARKNLYLYRRVMEQHLADRGKTDRIKPFIAAFRQRKRRRKMESLRQNEEAISLPDAPTSPALSGRRYPRTLGNVWNLRDEPSGFHYMSDQYEGWTMGFEERKEITLGETHPLAIGMVAFGHGVGLDRPLPEDFRFHVVDEHLFGQIARFQAKSHGVIAQRLAATKRHAFRTILALSEPQSGITREEAMPDSQQYRKLMKRIAAARDALKDWNKDFYLDRISLSLLAATPETPLADASQHYGTVAKSIRYDAAIAAGQASFPHIVVSQSAGSAFDGRSEVILAEGQLDIAHPTLGFIVATPKYPFALMSDMPATHDLAEQILVDELEVLAVTAVQDNQPWYCPALRQAYGQGRTILVEFSTLNDLVIEDGFHGFAIEGANNDPDIVDLRLHGNTAYLTLNETPMGQDVFVTYAWGASRSDDLSKTGNKSANQGSVRDSWSQTSVMRPDRTLHRYALSGRVRIMPSDLPMTTSGN